jgi:hypothetical protein
VACHQHLEMSACARDPLDVSRGLHGREMYKFDVYPELFLVIIAGTLALAFDYLPHLRQWFDGLDETQKRLLNAGLVIGAAVVLYVGDCASLFDTNLTCDVRGAFDLLYMAFLALAVNHGVHKVTRPSPALEEKLLK